MNIFVFCVMDLCDMCVVVDLVGLENDQVIFLLVNDWVCDNDGIICVWGVYGDYLDCGNIVVDIFFNMGCFLLYLGLIKVGYFKYLLYIGYSQ